MRCMRIQHLNRKIETFERDLKEWRARSEEEEIDAKAKGVEPPKWAAGVAKDLNNKLSELRAQLRRVEAEA